MEYAELIDKAFRGRKVLPLSKEWGAAAKMLDRYINGERMPDFYTTVKINEDSGVPADEL